MLTRSLLSLAVLAASASAHLSQWHPSMFGYEPENKNSDNMSQPLQDYTFSQWWWHGALDLPPADGEVFELKPNSNVDVIISSNKGNTPLGHGWASDNPREAPDPWTNTDNGWGNMHAPERTDVAGSALGIAYKSSQYDVTPDDFVIFSVKHDSPARQLETFAVPDLPACPDDKCMCAWFWIHKSIGGTDQMYMSPFVCNVTGATNTEPLGRAAAPRKCADNGGCVGGAKSPMYWKNLEGNNMFDLSHYAPTYSEEYGFKDGAQTDIWTDGHNGTAPAGNSTKPASTNTSTSTTTSEAMMSILPVGTPILVDSGNSNSTATTTTAVASSTTEEAQMSILPIDPETTTSAGNVVYVTVTKEVQVTVTETAAPVTVTSHSQRRHRRGLVHARK